MEQIEALLSNITVNTHSSIRILAGDRVLYIDPFRLRSAPRDADVIFVTHDHFDHFSPEDVEKVGKPETVFVMPESTAALAGEVVAGRPVIRVAPGERGEVLGLHFETVPAYNPAKPFHPRQNSWVGYVLTVDGLRVYVAGDTDATDEAAAVACDVALVPIGGKYTMDAGEAAGLVDRLQPRAVIPVHYGTVAGSPREFDRFVKDLQTGVRVCRKV